MELRDTRERKWLRIALLLAIVVAASGLAVPASAQWFGDRFPFGSNQNPYRPPPQQRNFFSFPFLERPGNTYNPYMRPPQPVESTKAPPPRKPETPPTSTVVVIGDSMADWLAYGLEERFADTPEIGVVRKIRPTSGLVRYDVHSETLEWSQAVKDLLATDKPSAIVIMLGLGDRLPLRDRTPPHAPAQRNGETAPPPNQQTPSSAPSGPADATQQEAESPAPAPADEPHQGGTYDFRSDQWADLYAKRIDDMIAAVKSKGVPVLWVGLPAIRGPRSTSDMSYLDELYRERAEKAGIIYVDIWDGFVDENGRYAAQGPDFEGQIRRLRTADGVHFTKAGAVKLASYVEQQLRRVMLNHLAPMTTPAPEAALPAKPGAGGARPAVGPVVPLSASAGGDGNDLLGAGNRPPPETSDPIAMQVLGRGDPLTAPSGRADDFSWPRPKAAASGAADAAPAPAALDTPASPRKPGPGHVESKVPDDAKAKSNAAPDAATVRPRRAPRATLDGAPRPPAPVGAAGGEHALN
jgi:hypothetical protein